MTDFARTTTGPVWVSTRLEALGLPSCTTGSKYTPPVRGSLPGCQPPAAGSGKHPAPTCFTAEDGTTYYLLTPSVWGWICRAMQFAGTAVLTGQASAADYAGMQSRFERLRRWVNLTYPEEELAAAVASQQPLPGRPQREEPPEAANAPRDDAADAFLAAAVERFCAERVADGDVPDFAAGPVQVVEREVYAVRAPGWPGAEGGYLVFSAEAYLAMQHYRRITREVRDKQEQAAGKEARAAEERRGKKKGQRQRDLRP